MPLNLKNPNAVSGKELDENMQALVRDWAPTLNRWSLKIENRLDQSHKVAVETPTIAKTVGGTGTGTGGVSSVALTAPKEFVVTGSPGTGIVNLGLGWTPVASGYELAGPPAGVVGFDGVFTATSQSGGSLAITGGIPSTNPEWALYLGYTQSSSFPSAPTGWTDFGGSDTQDAFYTKQLTAGVAGSVSQPLGVSGIWAGALLYFQGLVQTPVQRAVQFDSGVGSITTTLGANTGATNTVLAIAYTTLIDTVTTGYTLSNTQGLPSYLVASFGIGQTASQLGAQIGVWVIPNCTAASFSATIGYNVVNGGGFSLYEITSLANILAAPRFQLIPPTDLSKVTGTLATLNGGTGANLSRTGGTSQVLQQASLGAPVTVGQIAASDLSNGAVGTGAVVLTTNSQFANPIANYNSIATVANGVPVEYAQANNIAAVTNVNATLLYSVPSTGAGLYRVSGIVIINRAASTSSTLPDLRLAWTDPDNLTAQTADFLNSPGTGNSLTTYFQINQIISAKASTNINYQTGLVQAYASVGGTSMKYSIHLRLEAL